MLNDDRIEFWLSKLPDHWNCDGPAVLKRETCRDQLTPPHSLNGANMMGQTPKGPRVGDDDQTTPRAKRKGSKAISLSSMSLPSSQQGDMSTTASSPRRQLMRLRLTAGGMDCRQLDTDYPPAVAAGLVSEMAAINVGMDVLPHEMKDEILHLVKEHMLEPKLWRDAFTHQDMSKLPGRIPNWAELQGIRAQAKECFHHGHEEVSWNIEVHHPLLKSVFRSPDPNQPLDFMSGATPRPHRNFLQWSALKDLSRRTVTDTVNHTDYQPSQLRPIVLSIETKRPSKDLDRAQLQMGVWQSAHWKFLELAVADKVRSTLPPDTDQETVFAATKTALMELKFLPGIIIQGHRWFFVFSTLESEDEGKSEAKTILWVEQEFGSTQNMLKMYQTIAGLRRLAGWATDVYMPWYRKYVLRGDTLADDCAG
ncbi:hypothetical protein CDV31_012515 [Fusarium ambrosium]|uniref:PD-(D/E)XK nuclease-like domain-containing protein n=1 Tax=Fusarium ambrosium TaxID=131363 RepID=A0A428T9C0_9HYPO|nr:hypothetical protein CDV31_012515 [Fusarium ambrosium]